MKDKIVEHHLAAKEFKRRFPETWESFSNQQKKHIVYAMNGWRAEEAHLYSAGEEVYVKIDPRKELPTKSEEYFTNKGVVTYDAENKHWLQHGFSGWQTVRGIQFWLKKVTRPTVSEGEIEEVFMKHSQPISGMDGIKWMNHNEFKAAIKELLNQKR